MLVGDRSLCRACRSAGGCAGAQCGGTFAGYQLQALKQERQRLMDERSTLEVEEAVLLSPERLEKLARAQNCWSRRRARWSISIRTPTVHWR